MFSKKKLVLDVSLCPCAKNMFETGSGYSIDTGPRTKIIWRKPWINIYGHSLESNCSLSILEQFIDISYKIPLLRNPLEQYYLLQGGLIHIDTRNLQSSVATINIARCWNCSRSWQRVIHVYWRFNRCVRDCLIKNTTLIYPSISIFRVRKRGEIIPYWGDSQRYSVSISNACWKSNVNFFAIQAQNVWIRTLFEYHRFLFRGNLSWIKTSDVSSVASILRFFSSMDSGIRGYKYKSLCSYLDSYSEYAMGTATKLITATCEYQYNMFNKWWGSVFIDLGEIGHNVRWNNFKSGIGIGIRWQLPIGCMKLDMATPLIHKEKSNHQFLYFYAYLGPDL